MYCLMCYEYFISGFSSFFSGDTVNVYLAIVNFSLPLMKKKRLATCEATVFGSLIFPK